MNFTGDFSKIRKRMILTICITSLVFLAAGALVYRSAAVFPFALGLFMMAGLNVAKVFMLERSVNVALDKEAKSGGSYIRLQYIIRFLLTGLVLLVAAMVDFIDLWGAFAGIFTFQIAAYSLKFLFK